MFKLSSAVFVLAFLFAKICLAIDISSDTTGGSQTFSQVFSADGYFDRKKKLENERRTTWSANYTYSRSTTPNPNGDTIVDNTTEIDLNGGSRKKNVFETALGLTYATTPDENLKDYGPNAFWGQTFALTPRSEEKFFPTMGYKFTLSDLAYVQTFGTTTTTRLGKSKPTTGVSGINQVFPALQSTWIPNETFTFKAEYTHYFYNRNVNDFLATLDSPRAVAAGVYGLTNAVSSFNTDLFEVDINWFPLDMWEFDEEATAATSAIDGSTAWTFKEAALYDFAKNWTVGLSYQYEQSDILIEHLYTITVKFMTD